MKIEIKERGCNNFYDEFLFVLFNYKKIVKNPQKKVKRISQSSICYLIVSLVILALFTILYLNEKSYKTYLLIIYLFSFLSVFSIIYYLIIKKRINTLKNVKGTIIIEFNDNEIKYISNDNKYEIKWDNIKYIIINNYSICFIPKKINNILIGIDKKYIKEVRDAVKKYKKDKILIDNSNLYNMGK